MAADATIADALRWAAARLAADHDSARLDAEVLLAHALAVSRAHLHAHPERGLEPRQRDRYRQMIDQRVEGRPVAYLTARCEFWSLAIGVDERVLIPRPETERLVEVTLERLAPDAAVEIADLGTGSGAIALALASERPQAHVIGIEWSEAALALARANAASLGAPNVEWRQGTWCEPFADHSLDVIVTNPPYVRDDDPHLSRGDVRFEPSAALQGGPDGLDAIRQIVAQCPRCLRTGGHLIVEHGFDQGPGVRELVTKRGFTRVTTYRDAAGHERVTAGVWEGPTE